MTKKGAVRDILSAAPPSDPIPATGKGSRPRKAKASGPQIYAVGKEGEPCSALVKAMSEAQAIEKVTGRYAANVVGTEMALDIALANGLKGITDATVPTTD